MTLEARTRTSDDDSDDDYAFVTRSGQGKR